LNTALKLLLEPGFVLYTIAFLEDHVVFFPREQRPNEAHAHKAQVYVAAEDRLRLLLKFPVSLSSSLSLLLPTFRLVSVENIPATFTSRCLKPTFQPSLYIYIIRSVATPVNNTKPQDAAVTTAAGNLDGV
jgi:hypothetical protein